MFLILQAIKQNELMPFAATWMVLETAKLSAVSQRRKIYNNPSMCNLKRNETHDLIYKPDIGPQTQKRQLWLPGGEAGGKGREGVCTEMH